MQVKRIAECSKGNILQYLQPSLSYHLLLTYLFCLFLSDPLRQVLLYLHVEWKKGYTPVQWRSQNTEEVTHIKGRLLDQVVILFNCVPFHNGNFS